VQAVDNSIHSTWLLEFAMAPDSVLSNPRGGEKTQYAVTGFRPKWVLKVNIADGTSRQIPFDEEIADTGYTALSYPMQSAVVLAEAANFVRGPAPPGREYSLADRRNIARYFLALYCSTIRSTGKFNQTEYVWLDEFCLSDDNKVQDDKGISKQRDEELGRLADIFGGAVRVVVFCHQENCDHTGLGCIWGQRLFTIAEILHARTVLRLIRRRHETGITTYISQRTGAEFRQAIQTKAAHENRWHL
jgi:hypothetical protein